MKNLYFFCLILLFSITSVFSVFALCINTADNYAVEVLLNNPDIDYNLNLFNSAQNVIIKNNQYILRAEYDSNLALVLEKISLPLSGLLIRLQLPVKSEEKNLPYLKFSSTAARGIINVSGESYNGWSISCIKGNPPAQCEFDKEKTSILVSSISLNKYEITIETREELKNCEGCDGRCLIFSGEGKCISKKLKDDIESILKHAGLISSIEEILSSYKLISSGNAVITDLSPEIKDNIDWEEALKQELVRLKRDSIIAITNSDIEAISELAEKGKAGQNSRIVFGEDAKGNKKWLYYYETKFPILTKLENCQEFSLLLLPTGNLIFSGQEISTYWLIPLIITLSLVILLILLIITARVINLNKRKRKLKPITSLQSAV